ncbi:MAG: terpene cyclase/mutase family protein [Planctomycetota bacterium]|nr:terpene cyclase/mutase family protein [Planctomycetota bacterium]
MFVRIPPRCGLAGGISVAGVPLLMLCMLLPCIGPAAHGQDVEPTTEESEQPQPRREEARSSLVEITPGLGPTVDKALSFLASKQNRDGSFGSSYPVAETSLAGLAFMASGNVPGRGRYGENVARALLYMLKLAEAPGNRRGYLSETGGSRSRMHGHGYATLFLAEAYGMCQETSNSSIEPERLQAALRKAIKVIEESQTRYGGWGYEPTKDISDENSVTICQAQALRACRDVGLTVNKQVIDRAIDYIRKCQNPDGSFKYSLHYDSAGGTFPLAAGSLATLNYAGLYDVKELTVSYQFLMKHKPTKEGGIQQMSGGYSYFYYAHFYAVLAMYYAGGAYWEEWFPAIRDHLIESQSDTGAWTHDISPEYCTACGALILQVPYRYLPIFQK